MTTSPGRRRVQILVALLVVVVLSAGVVYRDELFGTDDVDDASERTTRSSPTVTEDTGSATTGDPARPTGTDPAIALEGVVDLPAPSAVADPAGPGPVLVATLDGRIHAVDLDAGTSEVVLDLSGNVSVGGERGLLGLAIDPAGERLYVNYTGTDGDTDVRSWPLADGAPQGGPGDGVVHLELDQPFANHNGGHLVFGPDGLLWIGTGDGGSAGDPGDVAQDPDNLLGKMLRVSPVATGGMEAPAGNPDRGGRPEVWAIGLRNPWRYSFDRETGRLWIADVGQNAVEEVSVVDPDASMPNFGWDHVEGDREFEGSIDPSFVAPVLTYGHDDGCSITGGHVYRGEQVDSLYGWYLYGDYCGGWVRAVPADDPAQGAVELVADAGPVVSFAELEDGELLVLAESGILRIVPA